VDAYAFPLLEGPPVATGAAPAPSREDARATIEAEARAAREAAWDEGFAAGREEALAALEPARSALLEAAAALERSVEDAVPEAERRAIELAVALAEKILASAVEADPELVASVVTGALRRALHHGPLVLEVNPADVELVRASLDGIGAELGGLPRLDLVGERRIPRGGCVVDTSEGQIDARLDTQLARGAAVLREP